MPINQDQLMPNESLGPEQVLSSLNGSYKFAYQGDGNLVLFKEAGMPLWNSGTRGSPAYFCIMQANGNLVIYAPVALGQWGTILSGHQLIPMSDGRVLDWVPANGSWWLWNYDPRNKSDVFPAYPIWSTHTMKYPGSRLVVQNDGNVVIYTPNNVPVWQTNKRRPSNPYPITLNHPTTQRSPPYQYGMNYYDTESFISLFLPNKAVITSVQNTSQYPIGLWCKDADGKTVGGNPPISIGPQEITDVFDGLNASATWEAIGPVYNPVDNQSISLKISWV